MLRRAILAYGVLAIIVGIALAAAGAGPGVVIYVLIQGVVVIAALMFERGRYRPAATSGGEWQDTAERFVDPSTGQLMKVRYNPQTGARDYVPVDALPQPPE
jgi:amino acid permease